MIAQLLAALRDPAGGICQAAATALGLLRAPETLEPLAVCARDRDRPFWVRAAAIRALAQIGRREAIPVIAAALWDPEAEPRKAAAEAVRSFDLREVVQSLSTIQGPVTDEVVAIFAQFDSDECTAKLVELLLRSGTEGTQVVRSLKELPSRAVARALLQVVVAAEIPVRIAAAETLAHIYYWRLLRTDLCPDLASKLISIVSDVAQPWEVRALVAIALGRVGGLSAETVLLEALHRAPSQAREAFVSGLLWTGSARTAELLHGALNSGNGGLALAACLGLLRTLGGNHKAVVCRLLRFAAEGSDVVRQAVAEVLGSLSMGVHNEVKNALPADVSADLAEAVSQLALDWLAREVAGAVEDVSVAAVRALVSIESPAALQIILRTLEHPNVRVRRECARALASKPTAVAVRAIARRLKEDNDEEVCVYCVQALGGVLDRCDCQPLVDAVTHPNSKVRQEAMRQLSGSSDPRSENAFLERLQHGGADERSLATEALVTMHSVAAVPQFVELLKNPDADTRCAAVKALDGRVPPDAIETLIDLLLSDPSCRVCCAAARVLGGTDSARAVQALLDVAAHGQECSGESAGNDPHAPLKIADGRRPSMVRRSENEWQELIHAAVFALAQLGAEAAINRLVSFALQADPFFVGDYGAIKALNECTSPAMVPALVPLALAGHRWAVQPLWNYCLARRQTVLPTGIAVEPAALMLNESLCPPIARR